ncbi:MAG: Methionine--tRNA ligase [Flavobacteriaceae bacterium]|jgi:methionyl-tRNA synthetase|nr:methionine--tRNA ligase [Flavobacteriaceae bacterium]CAI8239507.1 MAG: Methionine--tRNA ligase [Flavobacteriaceae bacterium]
MSDSKKRYTLTAALPYTNGPIHIGHLAGVYVPADIFARYKRLQGHDVAFICGSDEHGVAISMKARKEGITPKEVIDTYDTIIRKSFEDFGISFDNYSRTSRDIHHKTAQDFFTKLYEQNDFIEETSEQLFDAETNMFLADRFVTGTCPKCQNPEAYGDQCEKCGSSLNATDLINPKSTLSGATPSLKSTTHWYLPLDKSEAFLKKWILKDHKKDWKSNVYGQCKSWIDDGLRPRAVTRDLDWGIKVPLESADGKVLYVWFEAPIGYISSTKEWADQKGIDWEPYWKDENTSLIHFIGKDNIVFHCIIFPALLKAHGDYILPENVPANEFLNLEGQKLSTSKNWAVWLHEYLEDFEGMQDALRYVLTINAPETKDNDFTWDDFQARVNNELVSVYGNFINRVVVLSQKYYDGIVPEAGPLSDQDKQVLQQLQEAPSAIEKSLDRYRFREAGGLLMGVARLGNKYLADHEPWKLIKSDPERVKTIMNVALQLTAGLAYLSEPFLPFSTEKLKKMLNLKTIENPFEHLKSANVLVSSGQILGASELLFRKIEDAEIQNQLDKLKSIEKDSTIMQEPQKPAINYDTFSSLDLRVGTILSAEKMPKADRLLVLKVDTGLDQRTIVSGIAEHFSPEEVVGKKVCVLMNLEPRKLRGVESQGMLLMATDSEGKLSFMSPEDAVTAGSPIS